MQAYRCYVLLVRLRALLRTPLAGCLLCANAWAGYTHYYTWRQRPDDAALKACIGEMRLLIEARKSMLAGLEAEGAPQVQVTRLVFNGIGDDGHEPFVFPGTIEHNPPSPHFPLGFNFCKTAGKPYDEVVTACLLVARDHFPSSVLAIGSDGDWENGDWSAGARLYYSVFRRTAGNPIAGAVTDEEASGGGPPFGRIVVAGMALAVIVVLRRKRTRPRY